MRTPFGQRDTRPVSERAFEMAQQGDGPGAERLLQETALESERRSGEGSPQAAAAWNDLASLLMALGQFPRAEEAIRRACSGPVPEDGDALKNRLTYESSFALILEANGDIPGAEAALLRNLKARESFYGTTDPGYALGLEALAGYLMRHNRHRDALPALMRAGQIFWRAGHEHIAAVTAMRAECLKVLNDPAPPFAGLAGMATDLARKTVSEVCERLGEAAEIPYRAVLKDLLAWVYERFGPDSDEVVRVLQSIVEHERRMGDEGDPAARIGSARRLIEIFDRSRRRREALQASMALGLALSAAGDSEGSEAVQREAITRAEEIGDLVRVSHSKRNFGLYLADAGRDSEAEDFLRQALESAEYSRDKAVIGESEAELGIFLQHGGRFDEAQTLLEAAVSHMDAANPNTIMALCHLDALLNGGSCGCGETAEAEAIEQACREYVLARIPDGLVHDIEIEFDSGGNLKLGVQPARELSGDEMERLQQIITDSVTEFKNQLTS